MGQQENRMLFPSYDFQFFYMIKRTQTELKLLCFSTESGVSCRQSQLHCAHQCEWCWNKELQPDSKATLL